MVPLSWADPDACASALLPFGPRADTSAEAERWQLAAPVAVHVTAADTKPGPDAACALVSHRCAAPAVQRASKEAVAVPPGAGALDVPEDSAAHPLAPWQPAETCGSPPFRPAAESVSHVPAPPHVAVPVMFGALEVLEVCVAQALPLLWQSAEAKVLALLAWTLGASIEVVAVLTCAWQPLVIPTQPVKAVLALLAVGPAGEVAVPATVPVHAVSGQDSCELVCPLPELPGSNCPPWAAVRPLPAVVFAWAVLATKHPVEAAAQLAVVCDVAGVLPVAPAVLVVSPVVVAVQPGPAHWAVALDWDWVAGGLVTGWPSCAAA